jgi:hypothetical protein
MSSGARSSDVPGVIAFLGVLVIPFSLRIIFMHFKE